MKIRSFIHLLVSLALAVLPMAGHAQQTSGTGYVGTNTAPANTDNDSVHFNAAPGQPVSGGGGGGATDCPLQTRTWTNGAGTVSCSADVPATTNGNTTNVSDSIGSETGTASFTCNAGALNLNPGAVCNGPAACPAGTPVSWTVSGATCNGALASNTPSGANTPTVTDSTAPTTGAATFACTNGSLSVLPGSTCSSASTNCTAQPLSWTVGSNTCSANAPATNSGSSTTLTDSTAPSTGAASFTCNNGSFSVNAGATCTAPGWCVNVVTSDYSLTAAQVSSIAAGTQLEYAMIGGGGGGNSRCTAACSTRTIPDARGTVALNVPYRMIIGGGGGASTNQPSSGVPNYGGGAGSGLFGGGGGGYYTGPTPGSVSGAGGSSALINLNTNAIVAFSSGENGKYTGNGSVTASTGGTGTAGGNPGSGGTAGSSGVGGNAGTQNVIGYTTFATYQPRGANGLTGIDGGGSNGSDGTNASTAPTGFGGGGGYGSGGSGAYGGLGGKGATAMASLVQADGPAGDANIVLPAIAGQNGSTSTPNSLSSNDGQGGNAGIGVMRYRAPASGVCTSGFTFRTETLPAGTNCTTQSLSWTVGGATCDGTIAATTHGGTNAISDSTAPTTGSASFACNNGTYTQQAGATCSTAAPSSCAGQPLSWTVGGSTCDAVAPTTNSGNSAALTDSTAPTTGTASFACTNGTFTQQAGATCSTTSTSCAATTLSWSVGGNSCSGSAPITSVGGTANINSASANSGQATFACQAGGTWSTSPNASPAATCNAAPACTTWTSITLPTAGPGIHSARSVSANPAGSNNLFVASQVNTSAGAYNSTNGTTFTSTGISMVTAQQYSSLEASVVVGGNQLAAGYVNRTAYPGPTGGYYDSILVTRNGAEITNHPALTVPVASRAVAMATDGSNVVVLGSLDNENSAVNGGVGRKAVTYRSTDGGASYLNVTNPYLNRVNSASSCTTISGPNFTDMTFAAGRFIAVGQDTCNGEGLSMHSTDGGASWTAHPVIPANGALASSLTAVVHSGSRFVRGGFKTGSSGPYIDTSTDGVNFVQSSVTGAAANGAIVELVNRGSGVLFAISQSGSTYEMLRSADHGQTWVLANNPPPSTAFAHRSYLNGSTGEWYVPSLGQNPATLFKSTCN